MAAKTSVFEVVAKRFGRAAGLVEIDPVRVPRRRSYRERIGYGTTSRAD
jgi:hypothetical protein